MAFNCPSGALSGPNAPTNLFDDRQARPGTVYGVVRPRLAQPDGGGLDSRAHRFGGGSLHPFLGQTYLVAATGKGHNPHASVQTLFHIRYGVAHLDQAPRRSASAARGPIICVE